MPVTCEPNPKNASSASQFIASSPVFMSSTLVVRCHGEVRVLLGREAERAVASSPASAGRSHSSVTDSPILRGAGCAARGEPFDIALLSLELNLKRAEDTSQSGLTATQSRKGYGGLTGQLADSGARYDLCFVWPRQCPCPGRLYDEGPTVDVEFLLGVIRAVRSLTVRVGQRIARIADVSGVSRVAGGVSRIHRMYPSGPLRPRRYLAGRQGRSRHRRWSASVRDEEGIASAVIRICMLFVRVSGPVLQSFSTLNLFERRADESSQGRKCSKAMGLRNAVALDRSPAKDRVQALQSRRSLHVSWHVIEVSTRVRCGFSSSASSAA